MKSIKISGLKRPISKRKYDQIEELLDSKFTVDQIAQRCGKHRDDVIVIIRAVMRHPLRIAMKRGEQAEPGTQCPHDNSHRKVGLRCAWLAGHYDKHGLEAWEMARR